MGAPAGSHLRSQRQTVEPARFRLSIFFLRVYSVSSAPPVFPPETQSNWREKSHEHEHEDETFKSKRDADHYRDNTDDDPSAVGERMGGKSSDLLPVTPD